ncbi:hypothetical protein ACFL3Q_05980 [Planctomycetota bacterium]
MKIYMLLDGEKTKPIVMKGKNESKSGISLVGDLKKQSQFAWLAKWR